MPVDSFKYLPRSIAAYYQTLRVDRVDPIPWTALSKPLRECRFGLVTTAGIYDREREPPFDAEREKRQPIWGDPTYRRIRRDVMQSQIAASHLHINNRDILADMNIVLPVRQFVELEEQGVIGSLASVNYSFMGYQPNTNEWQERYAPEVVALMKDEAIDAVLLTPA